MSERIEKQYKSIPLILYLAFFIYVTCIRRFSYNFSYINNICSYLYRKLDNYKKSRDYILKWETFIINTTLQYNTNLKKKNVPTLGIHLVYFLFVIFVVFVAIIL